MGSAQGAKSNMLAANPMYLQLNEELHKLGVANSVQLTRIAAVSDQSSGKSSLLESLTGFSFPRDVGLCTRYITEITCRREGVPKTTVSIRAGPEASAAQVAKLSEFKRDLSGVSPESIEFRDVFREAATAMGIRSGDEPDTSLPSFSQDILRIEICGPNEDSFTIVDLPGIFETETPGVTEKSDIELVKSMVRRHISETRTIILAVVACTSDVATQGILSFAQEADPDGKRTLGVLTKPDLLRENATKGEIVRLVRGGRNDLELGYYVVVNRGADDRTSTAAERDAKERAELSRPPWCELDPSRLGIAALRDRLSHLLLDRTRAELPAIRRDIIERLREKRAELARLGASRDDAYSQRAYLGQMATRFAEIRLCALNASYTSHNVFEQRDDLKIVTRIRNMSEEFAATMRLQGHTYSFQQIPGHEYGGGYGPRYRESMFGFGVASVNVSALEDYPELDDIITEVPSAEPMFPEAEDVTAVIRHVHTSTRGLELGTFNPSATSMAFKEQSRNWEHIAITYVNDAIILVHDFVFKLLKLVCPDTHVLGQIWNILSEELLDKYQAALGRTRFLLSTTRQGSTLSLAPEYERYLSQVHAARHARNTAAIIPKAEEIMEKGFKLPIYHSGRCYVPKDAAEQMIYNQVLPLFTAHQEQTGTADDMCDSIHDILYGYYRVTRSRFVDNVYQEVVDHLLLNGDNSPLRVFGPDRVLRFTEDELRSIAGEDPRTARRREVLQREIANLEAGRKALARV
ncbi:hypothetical protein RB594_006858 [Gaeumannomyces avenae]